MSRPQRNRRLSRRIWSPEHDERHIRPVKRLFTPEIKRMLKDWLVRRRENPYPSRDEKKRLATETGLTYTQICNWFANWRRKLKNTENERMQNTWGMLIKNYNTNARGNVEQFSISSEDSIWEEPIEDGPSTENDYKFLPRSRCFISKKLKPLKRKKLNVERFYIKQGDDFNEPSQMEHGSYFLDSNLDMTAQCLQVSSTTFDVGQMKHENGKLKCATGQENKTKYKQKIMEKYLRDQYEVENFHADTAVESMPLNTETAEISKKWLDSATKFTPNKNNYYLEWVNRAKQPKHSRSMPSSVASENEATISSNSIYATIHHKDELDAAEALANLAFNCRQRMLDLTTTASPSTPINALSS